MRSGSARVDRRRLGQADGGRWSRRARRARALRLSRSAIRSSPDSDRSGTRGRPGHLRSPQQPPLFSLVCCAGRRRVDGCPRWISCVWFVRLDSFRMHPPSPREGEPGLSLAWWSDVASGSSCSGATGGIRAALRALACRPCGRCPELRCACASAHGYRADDRGACHRLDSARDDPRVGTTVWSGRALVAVRLVVARMHHDPRRGALCS